MSLSRELLFFFSALGAFNGLVLATYFLWFHPVRSLANRLQGALLLFLSVRIGKSVFYFFHRDLPKPILQVGLSACFFIGPLLFFFVRSEIKKIQRMPLAWIGMLLLWVALTVGIGIAYPYAVFPDLWNNLIGKIIYQVWLVFVLLASWQMKDFLLQATQNPRDLDHKDRWLLSIFVGNVLIFIAFYTVPYTAYIVGALCFSALLYLLVFQLVSAFRSRQAASSDKRVTAYGNRKIPNEEAVAILSRLKHLMETEKPYVDAKLKIALVAEQLGLPAHRLSQVLNDNLGQSFTDYINRYRVERAKELITQANHFSLEGIGIEAGFAAKSTFYAAFRRNTGTTPARFRQGLQEKSSEL